VLAEIEISDSLQQGLDAFFAFIPNLLAFLVILVIGYFIAKLVKGIVSKALEKLGLDRALHESDAGQYVEKVSPDAKPSRMVGAVGFWLIFLFVLSAAIGALQIPAVTAFMNEVLAYLPNVIAAVVIFVVAAALAGAVGGAVHKLMGDTSTGKLVRAAVPSLIMVIAVFMVLNQLKIAEEIVTITYAALLGSVALGMALAFGLGGREVAGQMLEDAQDKAEDKKDEAKDDLEKGKERAEQRADEAQTRVQDGTGTGAYGTA
jgi:succinate dehydrogenase/fumarate reductase cytochrome b subunit